MQEQSKAGFGVGVDISDAEQSELVHTLLQFAEIPVVAVAGYTNAGKSTLFKMLNGQETPDSGTIRIGDTVQLAYVDQSRDELDGSKTVWEEISGGLDMMTIGNYEVSSRAYIGRFNFKGADQQKFVKDLSGGERNRLHLAKLLKQGANVLLLDEPTNDLDLQSLRMLEEALAAFPGTIICVSHDRYFLDEITGWILELDRGRGIPYEGNYSAWLEQKAKRLEREAKEDKAKQKTLARELEWIRQGAKARRDDQHIDGDGACRDEAVHGGQRTEFEVGERDLIARLVECSERGHDRIVGHRCAGVAAHERVHRLRRTGVHLDAGRHGRSRCCCRRRRRRRRLQQCGSVGRARR